MPDRRPFHETIIDAFQDFGLTVAVVSVLGRLIQNTRIPKNHDGIIRAWKEVTNNFSMEGSSLERAVISSLEEQKREAEAEATAKNRSTLDPSKPILATPPREGGPYCDGVVK
jgi:hypothetical protein